MDYKLDGVYTQLELVDNLPEDVLNAHNITPSTAELAGILHALVDGQGSYARALSHINHYQELYPEVMQFIDNKTLLHANKYVVLDVDGDVSLINVDPYSNNLKLPIGEQGSVFFKVQSDTYCAGPDGLIYTSDEVAYGKYWKTVPKGSEI